MKRAPWLGGFWERLVRSVKRCLKKSVGRSLLTFEELRTLVVEIEATLNNRPLTYIYDDEEGLSYPLTTADLIYGRQIATMPHQRHWIVISTFQSLTKRARYHFRLLEGFTKQWRREYLYGCLNTTETELELSNNSLVGDIVVFKKEGSARCWWKLAKVRELLKSRDNAVRYSHMLQDNKSSILFCSYKHRDTFLHFGQTWENIQVSNKIEMGGSAKKKVFTSWQHSAYQRILMRVCIDQPYPYILNLTDKGWSSIGRTGLGLFLKWNLISLKWNKLTPMTS